MRLFVGINLPKKQRAQIHRAAKTLRAEELPVQWIDPDNFHVTLKFLGDVRQEQVDRVDAALEKVAAATRAFSTDVSGFGAFPTVRRPNVIWVGVGATPELRCLKQDIEWALGAVGFEAETRSFHPHVTLGRADSKGGAGAFRGFDSVVSELDFALDLKIRTIDLMRSHLSNDGARYSVLSSARLAS